jgi:3-hydroxyisobutyrate dehydrogenase-like beta-hydroxyacid dehydrogenase
MNETHLTPVYVSIDLQAIVEFVESIEARKGQVVDGPVSADTPTLSNRPRVVVFANETDNRPVVDRT